MNALLCVFPYNQISDVRFPASENRRYFFVPSIGVLHVHLSGPINKKNPYLLTMDDRGKQRSVAKVVLLVSLRCAKSVYDFGVNSLKF